MKIKDTFKLVVVVALLAFGPSPAFGVTTTVVATTETDIQNAINGLPPAGGTVVVNGPAGNSVLIRQSILIARDNITLRGEGGVVLRLANGAQAPVIIIGQNAAVPTVIHRNINVSDFIIDGNRANQASELNPANNALRNNGVSMRKVYDCTVRRLKIHSCRSGGIVTELGCVRLTISEVQAYNNQFDGLAAYQTQQSLFTHLKMHNNLAAGFSFDIAFNNNVLNDGVLTSNGTVGMFIRDSRNNTFANFQVILSGQHGIFLAQVDADATKPALGNTFQGCVISNSVGAGIRINDASCTSNLLAASQLVRNQGGGISQVAPNLLVVSGVITR